MTGVQTCALPICAFSHIPYIAFAKALAVTAALSNVISNVPAVLAIKPFVQDLGDPQKIWLVIAMSSTFAGNLTLVGSVANLIVAEKALQQGVEISFWRYARVGVPLTIATLALGAWWLN